MPKKGGKTATKLYWKHFFSLLYFKRRVFKTFRIFFFEKKNIFEQIALTFNFDQNEKKFGTLKLSKNYESSRKVNGNLWTNGNIWKNSVRRVQIFDNRFSSQIFTHMSASSNFATHPESQLSPNASTISLCHCSMLRFLYLLHYFRTNISISTYRMTIWTRPLNPLEMFTFCSFTHSDYINMDNLFFYLFTLFIVRVH